MVDVQYLYFIYRRDWEREGGRDWSMDCREMRLEQGGGGVETIARNDPSAGSLASIASSSRTNDLFEVYATSALASHQEY